MQTIKTAVVVVLLLFVLYGGYIALNHREPELSPELQGLVGLDEFGADIALPEPVSAPTVHSPSDAASGASNAFEAFAKNPNPSFSPPAPPSNPPLSIPSAPSGNVPELPEVPSLELPRVQPPAIEPPALPTPELPKSTSLAPPAGSLLPKSNVPQVDPGVAKASGITPVNDVPVLDLQTLHGQAKTMEQATQPRMPTSASGKSFANAKRMAMDQANSGNLKEALATLSVFYGAQDLTQEQHSDLVDLLDALAREVIFSQRHLLEVPYVVNPGETLEQVAKTCQVPVSILAKINGLDEQASLAPDRKLKVLQGPFRAEIVMETSEMTLFLGDLYAGRYPVSFGSEPSPRPGVYEVQNKQKDKNYYSANGMQIPAKDPRNPFGGYWIDLGDELCIHGSSALEGGSTNLGCISLSPLDAGDVFGMLGRGCEVSIRR
ncbi:MAG: LysM peptidoglycan-binding domain-containing protein [Pirellula sp.]